MPKEPSPIDEVQAAFDQLARAILSRAKARGVAIAENRTGERYDDRDVRAAKIAPYAVGASRLANDTVKRFGVNLHGAIDRILAEAIEAEGINFGERVHHPYALGVHEGSTATSTIVYHVGVAGLERVVARAIGDAAEAPPIVKALLP